MYNICMIYVQNVVHTCHILPPSEIDWGLCLFSKGLSFRPWGLKNIPCGPQGTVDFRNCIVCFLAETLAH